MLTKYIFAAALMLSLSAATAADAAGNAGIYFSPAALDAKPGQEFKVEIFIDPGSEKIDMARVNFSFPAKILEIKSFAGSGVFSYQAGANRFDNAAGTFSWGAGAPGGTLQRSSFGSITFIAKSAGEAAISLTSDSLLLSSGENKFNSQLPSARVSVIQPATSAQTSSSANKQSAVKKAVSNVPGSQPAVAQPFGEENPIDTNITPEAEPKSFLGSLADSLSFKLALRVFLFLAIAAVLALLGFTAYKIIKKPITK